MYWKYIQLTYPTWTFVYDCIFASKIDQTSPDFGESADSRAELQVLRGNLDREVIIYKCPGGASSPTHVLLSPHTHTGMGLPVDHTNPGKPLGRGSPPPNPWASPGHFLGFLCLRGFGGGGVRSDMLCMDVLRYPDR